MSDQNARSKVPPVMQNEQSRPRRKFAHTLRQWRAHAATRMRRSQRPPQPARNLSAFLRQWHQRAGLMVFLFMIWLGISGFLINQSASWGYDTSRIDWSWVTALYGVYPEPPRNGFSHAEHWLAVAGDRVVLDGQPVEHPMTTPRGMVAGEDAGQALLFIATAEALVVLKPDGTLYDELRPPLIPAAPLRRIGAIGDALIIESDAVYSSTDAGFSWQPIQAEAIDWSAAAALSDDQREALIEYSRPSIPLERVLVDAHSGQLFGRYGVWVVNAVAFIAVWLGISGVWMTWRTSRRKRQRKA
jgi:hypothetical protein